MGLHWVLQEEPSIVATKIMLKKVVPPVLIMLGTVGNALALAVLHRSSSLRQSSVWYYLKAFFVASVLVLYLGAGLDWLFLMARLTPLWNVTDGLCRIGQFFCNVVFFSPIWFCVAMVVDRYISICHQRTAETLCNMFSAKIAIISIQIGLILVSIHAMWTVELHAKYGCTIPQERRDFHSIVWPWVSVIIYTFLPLSLLILFNTVLFIAICNKTKCRNSEPSVRSSSFDNGKLSVAALAVATTYLLLALPATAMHVFLTQAPANMIRTRLKYLQLEFLGEIFQLLAVLNHAVMGIVCFCSSMEFRRETCRLFLKKAQRTSIELSLDECTCKYRPSNGSVPVIHSDNSQL